MNAKNRSQYDVVYPRHYFKGSEERVHFMNVGTAFIGPDGTGDVILYVVPPADEKGEIRIMLTQPEYRPERPIVEKKRGGP